jgi:hypothetical protein
MGVSGHRHAPAALSPRDKDPGSHCIGGCVGLRAGLDTEVTGKNSCLCRGSNLDRTVVQSVARQYTDCATPASSLRITILIFLINLCVYERVTYHYNLWGRVFFYRLLTTIHSWQAKVLYFGVTAKKYPPEVFGGKFSENQRHGVINTVCIDVMIDLLLLSNS